MNLHCSYLCYFLNSYKRVLLEHACLQNVFNDKPNPLEATSVAIKIGVCPERKPMKWK